MGTTKDDLRYIIPGRFTLYIGSNTVGGIVLTYEGFLKFGVLILGFPRGVSSGPLIWVGMN